jgi:choline-glycine betaine transporter
MARGASPCTSTLVASNDIDVVKAVSIAGAIPFTLVLLLQLWALVRVLRREPR